MIFSVYGNYNNIRFLLLNWTSHTSHAFRWGMVCIFKYKCVIYFSFLHFCLVDAIDWLINSRCSPWFSYTSGRTWYKQKLVYSIVFSWESILFIFLYVKCHWHFMSVLSGINVRKYLCAIYPLYCMHVFYGSTFQESHITDSNRNKNI